MRLKVVKAEPILECCMFRIYHLAHTRECWVYFVCGF